MSIGLAVHIPSVYVGYSGGPQWYWEGWIAANTPMFFWHSPIDWYASVEVYPNAWPATVEVTLVG